MDVALDIDPETGKLTKAQVTRLRALIEGCQIPRGVLASVLSVSRWSLMRAMQGHCSMRLASRLVLFLGDDARDSCPVGDREAP